MRLLNVWTGRLEEFIGSVPPYVILSHTWGDDEITFADLRASYSTIEDASNFRNGDKKLAIKRWKCEPGVLPFYDASITSRRSYFKLWNTCVEVLGDLDWVCHVWIDTFSIDKSSSAELSEAINSMFNWYRDAVRCYAYLEDISCVTELANGRWFTRGWTLQELVAPKWLYFFGAQWQALGAKDTLAESLSLITRIDARILAISGQSADVFCKSIASRMSWAAGRTTRPEDRAYSLLGLFRVNMSLLYGEGGDRAFRRLQEEIMKVYEDESLFAWGSYDPTFHSRGRQPTSLFADSPDFFKHSSDIMPMRSNLRDKPMTLNSRGVQTRMQILPCTKTMLERFKYGLLACQNSNDPQTCIGFLLGGMNNQYTRYIHFTESDGIGRDIGIRVFTAAEAAQAEWKDITLDIRPTKIFDSTQTGWKSRCICCILETSALEFLGFKLRNEAQSGVAAHSYVRWFTTTSAGDSLLFDHDVWNQTVVVKYQREKHKIKWSFETSVLGQESVRNYKYWPQHRRPFVSIESTASSMPQSIYTLHAESTYQECFRTPVVTLQLIVRPCDSATSAMDLAHNTCEIEVAFG